MRTAFLTLAILVGGCAHTAPEPSVYQRVHTFNEAEYASYAREGTASISGQAFIKTRNGDMKIGTDVRVNPVTTYSKEWWTVGIADGMRMTEADSRALTYQRKAIADGEGRFSFERLPPGEYYVFCFITWEYVAGRGGYAEKTGGVVGAQVKLGEGEQKDVILELIRVY